MIRAGMLKFGAGVPGELPSAGPGFRGTRLECGNGHQAEFVSYRDKVIGTVLGPVTLTRAWYHRKTCGHGFAPRDAELGTAGTSLSPGLTAMNDKAAAVGPFAVGASLLEDLAGDSGTRRNPETTCTQACWPTRPVQASSDIHTGEPERTLHTQ